MLVVVVLVLVPVVGVLLPMLLLLLACEVAMEEDLDVRAQRGAERVRNLEVKCRFRRQGSVACART